MLVKLTPKQQTNSKNRLIFITYGQTKSENFKWKTLICSMSEMGFH